MDQLKSSLSFVITVLPICIATLFLAGSASSSAFLLGLGLSSAQFSSSFEELVLGGFTELLAFGIRPLLYFLTGLSVVGVSAFVVIRVIRALRLKRVRKVRQKAEVSTSVAENTAYLDKFESLSDQLVNCAVVMVGLVFSVVALILVSDQAGRSAADRFKEKARSGKTVVSDVYFKSPVTVPLRGVLAGCNDSQCAYWLHDHSVIVNMSDVDRVESRPIDSRRQTKTPP